MCRSLKKTNQQFAKTVAKLPMTQCAALDETRLQQTLSAFEESVIATIENLSGTQT
jgi:hypothetical protein